MSQETLTKKQETGTNNAVTEKVNAGALSVNMFEADANQGVDNLTQEDLALPFLKILGQLSPEVNKRDGKYVEGAEPGMIYNSVTGELFNGEKGVNIIPCHYKLEYIEWRDRGEGSGAPVAIHSSSSDIMAKTTRGADYKDRLQNGNYILTVGQHFVIIVGDKGSETAMISMSSSQGKISRKWNSMMKSISLDGKNGPYTPPSFSHIYKLSSVLNTGKGNQWYGYSVEKVGMLEDANMYERAKKFYENIKNKA